MHGIYTISFENELPAYRYVRYQKAIPGPDIELGELRVFTEFSVREISRNKPAAADSSTVLSAEKGNDGLNEGNGDAWVSAGDAAFRYWQVDLEKSYPIDLIEIEGRNYETTPGDSSGRFLFEIYGSEMDMQEKLEELYPYDASAKRRSKPAFIGLRCTARIYPRFGRKRISGILPRPRLLLNRP